MRALFASFLLLTVAPSLLAQPRTESGRLGPGDDTLDSGEYADTYTVEVEAGQRLTADLTSDAFDPYLIVLAPSGEQTENDDWEGSYSRSRVEIEDAEGGTWRVRVTSYEPGETGAYTLTLRTGPASTTRTVRGTITDDDPVVPLTAVGNERRADRYEVRLEAGQPFEAELTSDDFDTYLRLELDGTRLAFNDDAGSTARSHLEYVAERGGTYTLYAGTFADDGRGAYTLRYTTERGSLAEADPPPAAAFADALNRVVDAFPTFDGVRGAYDEEEEHYHARVTLPGADESYVSCFLGRCSFVADFGDGLTRAEANRVYADLVGRVGAVRFNAGSFVRNERDAGSTPMTYWLPFSDNPDNLVLEVQTIHNPFAEALGEEPYGVVLRVTSF